MLKCCSPDLEDSPLSIEYELPRALPVSEWAADNSTDRCPICGKAFKFRLRRHHCRLCGGVFCGRCASSFLRATAPNGRTARVRACSSCAAPVGGALLGGSGSLHGGGFLEDDLRTSEVGAGSFQISQLECDGAPIECCVTGTSTAVCRGRPVRSAECSEHDACRAARSDTRCLLLGVD